MAYSEARRRADMERAKTRLDSQVRQIEARKNDEKVRADIERRRAKLQRKSEVDSLLNAHNYRFF